MRLWSLHPKYLDGIGLVALWREGLLAKHVLEGKTKGYKNHPQLLRFKGHAAPVDAINDYLVAVLDDAKRRGYNFDESKLRPLIGVGRIQVTDGQLAYELTHLKNKLKNRSPECFYKIEHLDVPEAHQMFLVMQGDIENWEVV